MTFNEAIAKAAEALDAAENNADVERTREGINAANTWLRMAEILNYCGKAETKTDEQ
jgi:hypothetical protein